MIPCLRSQRVRACEFLAVVLCCGQGAMTMGVRFSQCSSEVDRYDFVEIALTVNPPRAANPFTDVVVEGEFARKAGRMVRVGGFCDSEDGSLFRIRLMPTEAGGHRYSVTHRHGGAEEKHSGAFPAKDGGWRGLVRVDPFGKKGMGGPDEQRYYRYAIARFAAFSNVLWDVTSEYHLFRDEAWTNRMGALIEQWDPYGHLASVHGHEEFY